MAFREEINTPTKVITMLCNVFSVREIFVSIVNTLKKLYIRLNSDKNISEFSNEVFDKKYYEFFNKIYFEDIEFFQTPFPWQIVFIILLRC